MHTYISIYVYIFYIYLYIVSPSEPPLLQRFSLSKRGESNWAVGESITLINTYTYIHVYINKYIHTNTQKHTHTYYIFFVNIHI